MFSFANTGACLGGVALLDNAHDPFNTQPNSVNTNPGNQFANLGWGAADANNYAGNYGCPALCASGCHPFANRLMLQGTYDSSTKLMRDTLRSKKLIPPPHLTSRCHPAECWQSNRCHYRTGYHAAIMPQWIGYNWNCVIPTSSHG